MMRFKDRMDAGRQLAATFNLSDATNTVILGLPRGGIPLALELAKKFDVPYDVLLAKKIGHPYSSEYAIGAIAEDGQPIFNASEKAALEEDWLKKEISQIRVEMQRRRKLYNEVLVQQELKGKDIIIVDDGIATGFTMFAAIQAAKDKQAKRIAVAVPVIPKSTYQKLIKEVDAVYFVEIADPFLGAVGAYYQSFPQLDDLTVQQMLAGENS